VIGTTTVSAGTWSINYTGTTLADGSHSLDASLLDTAGNEASKATQQALVIDTSATLTPAGANDTQLQGKTIAIGGITDDTGVSGNDYITQDNKLVFTGTSTAADGANVAVKLNGAVIGYTTVIGGKWSYNYTSTTLPDGAYKIDASLVDAAGNEAGKATQQALLIDSSTTVNPDPTVNPGNKLVTDPNASKAISITAITDDTGTAGDFKTTDSNLVISGTSTAAVGSNVDIKVDGVHVGYATVQTGGTWSFDYSGTTLTLGAHKLDASIVDVAGNVVVTASQQALEILASTPLKNNTVSINGITDDTGRTVRTSSPATKAWSSTARATQPPTPRWSSRSMAKKWASPRSMPAATGCLTTAKPPSPHKPFTKSAPFCATATAWKALRLTKTSRWTLLAACCLMVQPMPAPIL